MAVNEIMIEDDLIKLEKGYIYGLVGRNGAGKTTLLRKLAKRDMDNGQINLELYPSRQDIFLINSPALLLPEQDLITNGQIFGGLYDSWDEEAYVQKLKDFHVPENVLLSELSRGNQMKVCAAMAWGVKAPLLLADEPSAGFDPSFRKEFIHFLQEYVEDGKHTVIISTHITEELDKVADYIMLMREYSIYYCKDIETLRESFANVAEAFKHYEMDENYKDRKGN